MNLRDMLNNIEEAPSSTSMRVAKATGQNHQVAQRSHDVISQKSDIASKNVTKQLNLFDFMSSDEFSQSSAFASMVEKARKEMLEKMPNVQPDPKLLQQSKDTEIEEAEAFSGAYAEPETTTGEIPINVLSNVMGDDTLVNLMRQALRQIQNERGINKRFMPALKTFMAPYVSILKSGFTGYNQIIALQKALNQNTDSVNQPGVDDNGKQVTPDEIPEPSPEDIKQYGVDNNLPTVSGEEQQVVSKLIKKDQADAMNKEGNMKKQESVNLKGKDELRRLSDIVEAMSDAYGEPEIVAPVEINSDDQVEGSVEFKQHKNTDKGSVSVEASGETMQDLADILKLAGLTLPKDMHSDEPKDDEPKDDEPKDDEPKVDVVAVEPDAPCDSSDASYSTDKEVLVNYLKDKLKKSIS
jgi:hypothetical protein